jgi:endonuclease/exonuclease/phosphatase family metal-dependent hydrolase
MNRAASSAFVLFFGLAALVPTPARAICPTCCTPIHPPQCTLPNGALGYPACIDGSWEGCEGSPAYLEVIAVLSDGRRLSAHYDSYTGPGGGAGGGGTLFTAARDNNLRIQLNTTDPYGVNLAYVSGTVTATCGKVSNSPTSVTRFFASYASGALPGVKHLDVPMILSASRWWDSTAAPCAGNQPADELQVSVVGWKQSGTGAWVSTPSVSIRLISSLRVMSWNIRHGSHVNTESCSANGDQIACMNATEQRQILADRHVDIALLQEVDIGCARSTYLNEPAFYAAHPSSPFPYTAFYLQGYNAGGCGSLSGQYGDAILSKLPIASTTTINLPNALYGGGGVGRAAIQLPPIELASYTIHITALTISNLQAIEDHRYMLQQISGYGLTSTKVAIWGGDFNTNNQNLDYYYASFGAPPRLNLVQAEPYLGFDHIFGSLPASFTYLAGEVVPNSYPASDHSAVLGVLRINGSL